MVDASLIKSTIKELLEANLDKETIYSTLKDIGAEEGEIDKYYQEVTNTESSQEESKTEESNSQENSKSSQNLQTSKSEDVEDIKDIKEEKDISSKTSSNSNLAENINKEDHSKGLEESANEVDQINKSHEREESDSLNKVNISSNNINDNELDEKIKNLQKDILEIKGEIKGLTKIMKDILEENRNILNKL